MLQVTIAIGTWGDVKHFAKQLSAYESLNWAGEISLATTLSTEKCLAVILVLSNLLSLRHTH